MKVLYLLGSGKPHGQSTSEALARYLHARLAIESGQAGESQPFVAIEAKKALHAAGEQALLAALEGVDLLVLASPIYIDSLPYPVVHAFEAIAARGTGAVRPCRFIALLNCGFPEASHCSVAQRMCALFAKRAGLLWAGGLSLGGGEAIAGQALERLGGRTHHARGALDMAAAALGREHPIPDAALALMATSVIPGFLYRLLGSLGWRRRAHALGTTALLDGRPFAR